MRYLQYSLLVLLLGWLTGCQDLHSKHRAEAMDRWNTARVNLTMNMARQQFESGDVDKASLTVQSALDKVPTYAPAHILMGQIYLEKDVPALARDSFQEALRLDPENAAGYYQLGVLYERWKDLQQAHANYLQAWVLQPDNDAHFLALVEVEVSLGQEDAALNRLVEQVGRAQRDASVYMVAANIFTRKNDHQRAVEMYRQARNLEPENSMVKESLAFALYRLGQSQEALSLFQSLLLESEQKSSGHERRQERHSYLLAMGDCYLQMGQYHKAKRSFEAMQQQDPLNPMGWSRLAQVALARGELAEAKATAERALSLKKGYVDALMVLGYVALKAGDFDIAEDYFNQVLLQEVDNGTAYCLLGQTMAKSGQTQKAKRCFRQALKIDPQDKLAKQLYASLHGQELGARDNKQSL